jgi:hypothetical protein
MNVGTITAIAMASVMVLGMLGALVALVFKLGTMNGVLVSFMAASKERDDSILLAVGKVEGQLDRHIEWHQGGKP